MSKTTGLYATDKPEDISEVLDIVKVNANKIYKTLGSNVLTSREELEGYGYLGLVDAFNTYSKEKWPKFTVYASFKVRGAIIDYLRTLNHSPSKYFKTIDKQVTEKIASNTDLEFDEIGNIKTIKNVIKDGSDTPVSIEYSDYLKLQQSNSKQFISLDTYMSDSSMHKDSVNPESWYNIKETVKKVLELANEVLDKKEQFVIEEQFFNDTSSQEIAKKLEISTSRVSQIRSSALTKLKALCLNYGVTYGL